MKKKNIYKKNVPRLTWKINPNTRVKGNKKKDIKNLDSYDVCIFNDNMYCDDCGGCEDLL